MGCCETPYRHDGCRCRYRGCECQHESCTGDRGPATACADQRGDCCAAESGHGFRRHHWTKAEKMARLEAYLAELKAEAQAVEERLEELRR